MPAHKDLKRLIRARMARTGESYSTARLRIVGPRAGTEGDHAMIVTTGIEDGRRLVTLTEVPRAYTHNLVRGLDFVRDGGRFTWEYPADAPCWDAAARNWERDGAEMLDQAHGVCPVDWEAGLAWIAPILDEQGADWFVIGSAAMAVRGLDVAPGGVDIAMDEPAADRLMPHVADGVLQPIVDMGEWPVATRKGHLFHGCAIWTIAGMKEQPTRPTLWDAAARASLDTVTWRDREVRVPPIELQLLYARMMFRNDHVRAINAYLATTPASPASSSPSGGPPGGLT
jgi:hypothetical protein